MAKREPITLTDNPLATSSTEATASASSTAKPAEPEHAGNGAAGPSPAVSNGRGGTQSRARAKRAPDSEMLAGERGERPAPRAVEVADAALGPAQAGPSLDEALTTVFARVPESIALAFERLTLAVRHSERQPSQKALPAQELLGALLWRYGNGDDQEVVREMIELLREYRAARYAASIKRIETKPAA
jgi:hypothetical protein